MLIIQQQRFFFSAHGMGTYLANRYLQVFQSPADMPEAVVGDSAIFGPDGMAFDISMNRQRWLTDVSALRNLFDF